MPDRNPTVTIERCDRSDLLSSQMAIIHIFNKLYMNNFVLPSKINTIY
jgi:hypothetical protein